MESHDVAPEAGVSSHGYGGDKPARAHALSPPRSARERAGAVGDSGLPALLTADDAALLLRTTRRAIYAMVERDQLPAPVRIGRRILLREQDLITWLESKRGARR